VCSTCFWVGMSKRVNRRASASRLRRWETSTATASRISWLERTATEVDHGTSPAEREWDSRGSTQGGTDAFSASSLVTEPTMGSDVPSRLRGTSIAMGLPTSSLEPRGRRRTTGTRATFGFFQGGTGVSYGPSDRGPTPGCLACSTGSRSRGSDSDRPSSISGISMRMGFPTLPSVSRVRFPVEVPEGASRCSPRRRARHYSRSTVGEMIGGTWRSAERLHAWVT